MNEMREEPGKSGKCLHREEYQCTLTDKDKLIPGDGTDCTHSCCWECEKHGECWMECYSSANRPENGPEQPPLPLMRNNDQRKEWLRNYKSWGLWYEDEHIGCRYYKYDFDNGARLIAEVYDNYSPFGKTDYESSYLHLVGGPEPDEHPSGAYGRWSRHERYNRFPNSETELVEFLKSIQKGERK